MLIGPQFILQRPVLRERGGETPPRHSPARRKVKKLDRFEKARLAASSCLLRLPFSAASIRPTIQLLLNSINREEQNGLGSHAGLHHRYRRSRAAVAERISGCGEPVWSKISNALKRLGFRSHNFLAQLLSETSRACTIRVRRSSLGRLWHDLGSHAGLHHRNRRPGTSPEERISGRREPDPESPNPRQVVVIGWRKSYVGGDRPPARTESLGRIGGGRETGYPAGLVPKAHRQQVRRIEVSRVRGSSQS